MQYSGIICSVIIVIWCISCTPDASPKTSLPEEINPHAEGFNVEGSDSLAVRIADEVMEAMGGRRAFDNTRYLRWNFFGSRVHTWDRYEGDLVIEGIKDSFLIKMNLNDSTGTVTHKGVTVEHPDSLSKFIHQGVSIWINDSYWLIMPFKLKDTGVTLKYVRRDTTQFGRSADVLSLTFDQVGDTPQNKYWVYVDDSTRLISQWDFFTEASDTAARFTTPWLDYRMYDRILLSDSRGEGYTLDGISASDTLSSYFE